MKTQNYHCSLSVNTSPGKAFEGISERVGEWWTDSFKGSSSRPGDTFTVRFGKTFVNFEITEVETGKKIVWKVTDSCLDWLNDKKEWNNTTLVWEIAPEGKASKISMTHMGLVPEVECYENCRRGWDFYVKDSLFKLLTTGKGAPDGRVR